MTQKLLVIFKDNWADEIDIKGFEIVLKSWWDKYVEKFPDESFSSYVGSNEEVEYTGKDDYFAHFQVKEISDEFAENLVKVFGSDSFGQIVWNEDFDMDEEEE